MRRFYVSKENINDKIVIDGNDFNHLKNVLRLVEGEEIVCFCGDGYDYFCKIVKIGKKFAECVCSKKELSDKTPKSFVTLFQGVTKSEKLELIVQKMTELGISQIKFFKSNFTSRKELKLEKLKVTSIEASKQCGRSDEVLMEGLLSFENVIENLKDFDQVIYAYEKFDESRCFELDPNKKTAIIIGSEGGFSEDEFEKLSLLKNVVSVSLGKRILRSETAAIALTSVVMFKLGELR